MAQNIDRRQFLAGASAFAALVGLSACGTSGGGGTSSPSPSNGTGSTPFGSATAGSGIGAATKKTPVYAQNVQVTSLDPGGKQPQVYPAGYEAAFAIFAGLIRFDADLEFQPDLATSWSTSSDGLTWTFKLREGVTFQDGTTFNADAVVNYFKKMLDETYNLAAYSRWSPISTVSKVDDATITISTQEPYAALLNTLAHGSALIPSPAAMEKYGKDLGLHPVGAGPYRVKDFQPGQSLTVERFAEYYAGSPLYDTVTYRYIGDDSSRVAALRTGQVDIIDAVPVEQVAQLTADSSVKVIEVPGLQVFGVGLNFTTSALRDKVVRQALNFAIDKKSLVTAIYRGHATVLDSPLAPNTTGHVTCGSYEFDAAKAEQMLTSAGYQKGADGVLAKNGKKLALRLRTPDGMYPNDVKVAQAIQAQLKQVGVEVTIDKVDKSTFWDSIQVAKSNVDFDLVLFGYNPSDASGATQLDVMYRTNSSDAKPDLWNFNWYGNPDVDAAITKGEQSVSVEAETDALSIAEKAIWDDCPYVWLYVLNIISAYRTDVAAPEVLPVVFTLPSRSS